jgi:hypothetical protein
VVFVTKQNDNFYNSDLSYSLQLVNQFDIIP